MQRTMKPHLFHFPDIFLFFPGCFTAMAQPLPLPLKTQSEEYFFEEVKLPGGAPVRGVLNLAEDNRGFIWMVSKHGLLRYDGHDFKRFRYLPDDSRSIVDTDGSECSPYFGRCRTLCG